MKDTELLAKLETMTNDDLIHRIEQITDKTFECMDAEIKAEITNTCDQDVSIPAKFKVYAFCICKEATRRFTAIHHMMNTIHKKLW
jgi:hypothetical protein